MAREIGKWTVNGTEVTARQLMEMWQSIAEFNDKFSISSTLSRGIFGLLGPALGAIEHQDVSVDEDNEVQGDMTGEVPHQEMSFELLWMFYSQLLENLGLGFQENIQGGNVAFLMGESIPNAEIKLAVRDITVFAEFLTQLTAEDLAETPELQEFLATVIRGQETILTQLGKGALVPEAATKVESDLASWPDLMVHLTELGFGEKLQYLSALLENYQQGCLSEYTLIQSFNLFAGLDHFGPGAWQTDTSPEQLQARWRNALIVLEAVSRNPQARLLHARLFQHLEMSCAHALSTLSNLKFVSEETIEAHRETLLDVQAQLG